MYCMYTVCIPHVYHMYTAYTVCVLHILHVYCRCTACVLHVYCTVSSGSQLWSVDEGVVHMTWNFYNVLVMPDFTDDGIPELLLSHGGDPRYKAKVHCHFHFVPHQLLDLLCHHYNLTGPGIYSRMRVANLRIIAKLFAHLFQSTETSITNIYHTKSTQKFD